MYHDRISSMTRYNSLVTLRETNRWHKSRGKWMRVHSRAAWTANCRSLVSRSCIPKGKGAGISREYLFLLASYDFPASDIYYIRHSAFRAKISFLPRVQYDNSSPCWNNVIERMLLFHTVLWPVKSRSSMHHSIALVCVTSVVPDRSLFVKLLKNFKNAENGRNEISVHGVSIIWICIVDQYIWTILAFENYFILSLFLWNWRY